MSGQVQRPLWVRCCLRTQMSEIRQ